MAKVVHLTDGETNWSFRPSQDGTIVKITIGGLYAIREVKDYGVEEAREVYKLILKFNSKAKRGFTKMHKLRKLTTEAQVIKHDNECREWIGEDNWPEHSLSLWQEFHYAGHLVVGG